MSSLTGPERELYFLLAGKNTAKEDVTAFLNRYDIDAGSSACAFLINELLDRFCLQESDNPSVPRIRGLADFFRFQNATAVMQQPADAVILDPDLFLKLKYPDTIRPFPAFQSFLDANGLIRFSGKHYAEKVLKSLEPLKLQNKEFLVPGARFWPDILFWGLYRSLLYDQYKNSTICFLYDIHRYCSGGKPSSGFRLAAWTQKIRHGAGRIKRWLLKSAH